MQPVSLLVVTGALFVGSHLALSHPLRDGLARGLGERGFLIVYSVVALATFVSEDLTCIGAGLLVAADRLGFVSVTAACLIGIVVGDLNAFFAGRIFGRAVLARDGWTCQYCGSRPGTSELTIDHIKPRSQGGASTWENCVLACVPCNARKANRTPDEAGMKLRRPPFRPSWRPHYASQGVRIESWAKFMSEAYWNISLDE